MALIDPNEKSNADRALESVYGENRAPFTKEEYKDRLRRVRQEMERHQIDTLIVSDPANLCYLSGYQCAWYQDGRPRTWYPDSCIAVRVDSDEFIYFEDLDEVINSRITSVTRDLRSTSSTWSKYFEQDDDDVVTAADPRSAVLPVGEVFPGRVIAKELEAAGWLAGNVALELWSSRPSRGYSEFLQQELERGGRRHRRRLRHGEQCAQDQVAPGARLHPRSRAHHRHRDRGRPRGHAARRRRTRRVGRGRLRHGQGRR